ncbi:UNC93-like protein [Camponotus floridanus]|uniref:UNC93-like protein n=1 Tax=Camponotus floridanus TaxID=104421 RepID=E2AQ69_CAMFO|nr:UNC93-like protein isoform X1 [Camponotus floridanus]XP_011262077.1 UNC93-like protein isoform X1 [Camponotus floridanus]XP_011262078.1 UNC93-like protein isoform X1 [Camponotus floridanus]EFN64403.1 UNC93-like protein [Camponotus floridanus]
MGSLPNLHELSKEKLESPVYKPAPIGSLGPVRLPPQPPPLAHSHKRARSSGHHHSTLSDNDAMLEHMAAYSPISCRSTRTSALSWRRRDSMNSSAGASSVRRLIAAVRAAPAGPRPPRKAVLRHIAALLLGHASCSAATLPIFPLQAGLGAFEPHLGPVLLAQLYMMAAVTSCFAPIVVQRLGTNLAITASHVVTAIFVGVHLYPKWYILAPSYAMLGCCASSSFLARTSHINVSANSLAMVCVDPEDPDETRRECLLRRLNRGIKLAEDIGLAIGCLIAAVLVRLTDLIPSSIMNSDIGDVCGAEYCSEEMYFYNESLYVPTIASGTSRVLVSIWLGLAVLGLGISCAFLDSRMQEPQANHDRTSVKDILKSVKCAFQDPKLQLAAPLTLFIGLEQGFIYADFMEAYVVCTSGDAGTVTLNFLSLALLQALAAVTLSMLLRQIKRYYVVVVGFAFHACLLLVLVTWRPTGDDPALFHVISAAWGVCNSIWETLIYTLVMGLYPNAWQGPLSTSLFWRWLGLTLALSLHGAVCTRYRVLGLAATLVLAVVPHLWLESRLARRGKTLAPL